MSRFEQVYSETILNWTKSKPVQRIKMQVGQSEGRPIVLYGAGRLGRIFLDVCKELGITVGGICDQNTGGGYFGCSVMSVEELKGDYLNAFVLVCSHSFNREICDMLEGMGFRNEQIIPCPIEFPYFESPASFARYYNGYAWAYDFFQDERSKQLVLDRMKLYLEDQSLAPNTASACYYENGLIQLGKEEIFVDGGAFTGDSAEYFIRRTSGRYSHIYSFEPSTDNFSQATKVLGSYPSVDVIQKGLWSKETVLSFYQDNGNSAGSRFVNGGGRDKQSIAVTALDSFFAGTAEDHLPSFIKMDIEGSEKEALIGAEEIIRRKKPRLAICAYHKPEDVYELPKTILSIRDDYRFALRQHEFGCYDTVLYAI